MRERDYNIGGVLQMAAAAIELVPMIITGTEEETMAAVKKIYDTARVAFPSGPREAGVALNKACAELDLPLIFQARNKDTGELL